VQAAKSRQHRAARADESAFDEFEVQPVGAQAVAGQYPANVGLQLGSVQLPHRQIDADEYVGMSGRERHGLVEHPVAERDDQTSLFGDAEEPIRGPHRVRSAGPAQQGLVAGDADGI